MRPAAVVMNMFYTGLGVARSLGEQGIPVIGLTSHRGIYGNFTRYARVRECPDSREEPEALLEFLLRLGEELGGKAIIFPTRDNDVLFLDRFRDQLSDRFVMLAAAGAPLHACLDKTETYRWACLAEVPAPRCWSVAAREDVLRIAEEAAFPCVLKPISAHHWRKGRNWELVGGRKAIAIFSQAELIAEYDRIAQAESRALVQEMVPGPDDSLFVAACYLDQRSRFVAGFTAQKLLQVPEGFGTGCIVQTVDRPDLLATAARLLEKMRFTGIAEVEFKRDVRSGQYQLIEINPRPWDQHRLGKACGVDLVHLAYCDLMGLNLPPVAKQTANWKWIADDVFLILLLRMLWRRDEGLGALLRLAHGRRTYAVCSLRDPVPMLRYASMRLIPELAITFLRYLRCLAGRLRPGRAASQKKGVSYENQLRKT